jgi:hypothetical protein
MVLDEIRNAKNAESLKSLNTKIARGAKHANVPMRRLGMKLKSLLKVPQKG